jgi:transposase
MSKRKSYKRYSPEFKREALKRASEEGVTDILVCEELDISARQLRRWRDEFRLLGDDAFLGQGRSRAFGPPRPFIPSHKAPFALGWVGSAA